MEAGGPHTLTVTDGVTALSFADVMIGDVYFAGGQSNMEMLLEHTENGPELARTLDRPMIRYINFPRNAWLDEQALQAERKMRWKPLSPGQCGDISAVACHFALHLQPEIGVPIGIIGCYWGGTSVVCWMDEDSAFGNHGGYEAAYGVYAAKRVKDKTDAQYDAEMKAYDDAVPGLVEARARPAGGKPGDLVGGDQRKGGAMPVAAAGGAQKRVPPGGACGDDAQTHRAVHADGFPLLSGRGGYQASAAVPHAAHVADLILA